MLKVQASPASASKQTASGQQDYPLELDPIPEFIQHRISIFDRLKAEQDAAMQENHKLAIKISLPGDVVKEGVAWETTPFDIALGISKSLASRAIVAKVNGEMWDLGRPLEVDAQLELLDFDHPEAKRVFWHSSAHMLGQACERHYGCNLCIGPPIEEGFYYEMGLKDRVVSQSDYPNLEKLVSSIAKEKQKFVRLEVSKQDLLEMFASNPYKIHIINDKIPDGSKTTVYRNGPLIDLCRGPHVPDTSYIKAMMITKNSASYFLGNAKNDSLQRLYGVSFPDKKQLNDYKKFLEEAKKRDHRKIGRELELFFFHELSPGSAFMLPHGARIYNALMDLIKNEYQVRGFTEVMTPNMYNMKLWEISGHAAKYQENMFCLDVEKEKFALKPMNCPGHCLMFGHKDRSYRDLPIRFADFGVLHRNEFSGALSGLTRVRRFQVDDAHIFCRVDQIDEEMNNCFEFLSHVYGIFGFDFHLKLSTRPEDFIGDIAVWNSAEEKLEAALNRYAEKMGFVWELNPGDGAFYGPKIDIQITDALRRKHQCATIQLDFMQPERFKLSYRTDQSNASDDSLARPVIIHRAILGSVERMMGILLEHYAGFMPFWLSPRQVCIVPVAAPYFGYAEEIAKRLVSLGIYADADLSDATLSKKIRNAELSRYNFTFVVGEEEHQSRSVNVRNRDDVGKKGKNKTIALDEAIQSLLRLTVKIPNPRKTSCVR
ncbi:threonyl-tRNA synthetase [Hesseltinella vesiculosa]|uniref:Probable threonine--tRNA ligase, cytoplasmic n=1 Tax=Hesseltinella vesiculosa TaxID=101127 RepID=A0A1X2G5C1_9FUNG|nr:threonyl-tRNA synthetase [Hesseltinella vesiculosa]